mgnify:CR=1 FL=1
MYKFNLVLKRLFDVVSSGIAIIVLIPVWIGASIAIKKDSKGPVFFKQGRRTKDGKEFQMLKFRSISTVRSGSASTTGPLRCTSSVLWL